MAKHDSAADIKKQSNPSSPTPKTVNINKVTVKQLPKGKQRS
ncbi:MAG: hypothetical protein QQN63_00030 [Nitrosopumilus sp.]